VSPQTLLGEDEVTINGDLEKASGSFDQLHLGIRVVLFDFGRQTGSPRFVVSDYAVLDGNLHLNLVRSEFHPQRLSRSAK
jgi:hypothetical protein